MCAKLRTVAASNNRDYASQSILLLLAHARKYIFVLRAHPFRGESHNQRNATGEVATAPEVSLDRIRIGYSAGYLRFFWIGIRFGYLFLKKIGSGQDQDICLISITKFYWEWFKMSQMMVLLFSLLWFICSQKIKMILSVCAALITIDDNSCYIILNIFWRGGSSKLLLYCWYAAFFCCVEWHMCVLCTLI